MTVVMTRSMLRQLCRVANDGGRRAIKCVGCWRACILDGSDAVTTTYQAGDVKAGVTDADRNGDAGSAETVEVLLTSDTENTGAAASVSSVSAGF